MKDSCATIMIRELLGTTNDCFGVAKAIAPSMRRELAMRARQRSFMVVGACVAVDRILGSFL